MLWRPAATGRCCVHSPRWNRISLMLLLFAFLSHFNFKWNVYDDKNARTPLCVRWQYAPKNVFPAQCNGMFVHNDDDSLISLYFSPTIFTVFCDIWCSTGYFLPFIPNGYLSFLFSLFFSVGPNSDNNSKWRQTYCILFVFGPFFVFIL